MSTAHTFVPATILFDITSKAFSAIFTSSSSEDTRWCPYRIKSGTLEVYLGRMSGNEV